MITEKDIKPIPKYIQRIIENKVKNSYTRYSFRTGFYSYLAKYNKQLCKITVAYKVKNNQIYMKQVVVQGIHEQDCLIKDIVFYYIAGYVVGWYNEGLTKYKKWYEKDYWAYVDSKSFHPSSTLINPEFALKFKQYKFSASDKYVGCDILKYLQYYEKYPQAEYLVKLGLSEYATKKTMLEQLEKDKQFKKFVIKNAEYIQNNGFYAKAIIEAYKKDIDIAIAQRWIMFYTSFSKNENYEHLKNLFGGSVKPLFNYMQKQRIYIDVYLDYLKACEGLRLDMNLPKNKIPHDFKFWHDTRITEYNSKKAELDKIARKELYEKFDNVANKYKSLETNKDSFAIIIAKSPQELISEGETLHHCVGKMGYDQKFVNENSLIFFARKANEIEKPFVTLEYNPRTKKILQCYAEFNKKPEENILDFIYKVWLPLANKQIQKIKRSI